MANSASRKRESGFLIAFLVLIIGIVFARGVFKFWNARMLKENCTASTNGIVTRVDKTQKLSDNTSKWLNSYHTEAEFYLNDVRYTAVADERRGKNDHGQNARFHVNNTVTIMYNPSDPSQNYIKAAVMDTGKTEMLSVILVPSVFLFLAFDYRRKKQTE